MKIVFFLRDISDCGGIQQTTCNLINSLLNSNSGYEISTISLYHKSNDTFFLLNEKVERIALFNKPVNQRFSYFSIKGRLKRAFSSISYDILVVQGILFSIYLPKKAFVRNNVITCEHGHYGMGTNFGFHAMGRKNAIKKAKAIVTLTELDRDVYREHCSDSKIVEAIPNAYLPLGFIPTYYSDSKTIISVGTLDNIKQMDHVIKAAQIVLPKYPEWKWLIYGDGPNKNDLQNQIEESGLKDRIILCGYETDKKVVYGDKSFLVLTSKFEGFGMVLLEALQFKLPLISYNVKFGPKEIVQEGINGHLVDPNNIEELAKAVSNLIDRKEERIKLSNNSVKTIDCFSQENVVAKWEDLFHRVLNN